MNNDNRTWYDNLKKPPLTPPGGVISTVWFILYIMIFTSFVIYLSSQPTTTGIIVFVISFILNLTWYPVFFNAQQPGYGLIVIIALLISIALSIWQVSIKSKLSAWLLVPYLLWVAFATYLNAYIYAKN
jgi:benzodiazapine receptor